MTQSYIRDNKTWLITAVIIALIANGGVYLLNIWLSPTGLVLRNIIFGLNILQGALLIFVVLQLFAQFSAGGSADKSSFYIPLTAIYLVTAYLGLSIAQNWIAPAIKDAGYRHFIAENQRLVDAILAYEQANGTPPEYLADLAPDYLPPTIATLPETEIANTDPDVDITLPYESLDVDSASRVSYNYISPSESDTAVWELAVSIYLGSFKSVTFVYTPTEQYPEEYGRLDDWGYRGEY